MIRKFLNKIEKNRNSEKNFWKLLITIKDFLWEIRIQTPIKIKEKSQEIRFILSGDSKKIKKLKNKYKGKRCFIIGNGPSLNKTNLSLLKNEYTFAVKSFIPNGIKMFQLIPNFYCFSDRDALYATIHLFASNIPEKTLAFLPFNEKKKIKPYLKKENNIYYINDTPDTLLTKNYFSANPEKQLYRGGQTIIIDYCLPLAFYMGFKEIYLIGCDCSLKHGKHYDKQDFIAKANPTTIGWDGMFKGYKIVKKYADKHNIKIKNATVGGDLEIFERIKLESLL